MEAISQAANQQETFLDKLKASQLDYLEQSKTLLSNRLADYSEVHSNSQCQVFKRAAFGSQPRANLRIQGKQEECRNKQAQEVCLEDKRKLRALAICSEVKLKLKQEACSADNKVNPKQEDCSELSNKTHQIKAPDFLEGKLNQQDHCLEGLNQLSQRLDCLEALHLPLISLRINSRVSLVLPNNQLLLVLMLVNSNLKFSNNQTLNLSFSKLKESGVQRWSANLENRKPDP